MDKTLERILALTIIGATLAFGGVLPSTYSLVEAVLFLALLLLLLSQTRKGRIDVPLPLWPILFVLMVGLQVIPFPASAIAHLSPSRFQALGVTGASHAREVWSTFSIFPHDTVVALLKFLAYLSAVLLAAHLFDSRKCKSTLLGALVCLASFEGGLLIAEYLTSWNRVFAFVPGYQRETTVGTYVNRNHFAGLLELALPFVLGSVFYSFQIWSESRHGAPRRHHTSGNSPAGSQGIFYSFVLVLLAIALLLSRSRGGILAAVLSLIFVALLAQLKVRRRAWMLGLFLFFFCVLGYGLWIGLDPVLARFEQMREPGYLQMEGRIALWKDAVRLIRDYPLVGTGLGTFGTAFRRYQTNFVDLHADHAHNDYLEFASETGLVGAALLFLPILYLLIRMIVSFLGDPRRYRRAVTLGCIGATLALMIHSVTDFNLQIPANALIFASVLGIGYKAACVERRGEARSAARRPEWSGEINHSQPPGEKRGFPEDGN